MATELPVNIKKSSVLPYWFFLVGATLFSAFSWAARGIDVWIWLTAGLSAGSLALLLAGRLLFASEAKSKDWFRNLRRFAVFAMAAGAIGFLIRFFFALGAVYVENETPLDVRLVLDGAEWLDMPARSKQKKSLTRGIHTVEVYTPDGLQKLDEHPIDIRGCGKYVLNVFGAQTYFQGEVVYGVGHPPEPKVIREKWFQCEPVDYLFESPPEVVVVRFDKRFGPSPTKRTYLVRSAPRG